MTTADSTADAESIRPFVGVAVGGDTIVQISELGVIVVSTSTQEHQVLQADRINGRTVVAHVTYSDLVGVDQEVGSTRSFTLSGSTLDGMDFRPGTLAMDIGTFVGTRSGHGREVTVLAGGQVELGVRDQTENDPSVPHLKAEGFIVTGARGQQSVLIYLSKVPGFEVAQSYPLTLDGGVLKIDTLSFCDSSSAAGACGA